MPPKQPDSPAAKRYGDGTEDDEEDKLEEDVKEKI
jgi:hypothetical protein